MKPIRLLFIGFGAVAVLFVVAVAVIFNPSFQTWAARKAVAGQSGKRITLGSVSAGWRQVRLTDLHFEQDGAVLTIPAAEIEMPVVSAGLRKKISVSRLVAKGWTL